MNGSNQEDTHRTVERVARESSGRLVAYLPVHTHDLASAEDALSNALVSALSHHGRRIGVAEPHPQNSVRCRGGNDPRGDLETRSENYAYAGRKKLRCVRYLGRSGRQPMGMVPGARIELATPAFSGRRSTSELPRHGGVC